MTTKLRHPHVVPLRAVNINSNFISKSHSIVKRKSAVQLLQESKAFYVKSETVLDKKQEFKPGRESAYGNFLQVDKNQKIIQKNNKLQDKLRLLLDFDNLDNPEGNNNVRHQSCCESGNFRKTTQFQHKSLPDLHTSPYNSSTESSETCFDAKCDEDCKSAYSSITQPESSYFNSKPGGRMGSRSTKNFGSPDFQKSSRIYCSFRVAKSGELGAKAETSYQRENSNTSSCGRSRRNSSSKHSQSADSGRQSQSGSAGLRTGRSGLPEFSSPPPKSSWSDSGTEDDSPPLFRKESCGEIKKRPILRSKSDISYKYCAEKQKLLPSSSPIVHFSVPTTEKLEKFFDHLGMDPVDFRELATESRNSSPVFFSSVSSIDSCVDLNSWNFPEPYKAAECPSIVERNARIVKWLYNCRKFQKINFNEVKTQSPCDRL